MIRDIFVVSLVIFEIGFTEILNISIYRNIALNESDWETWPYIKLSNSCLLILYQVTDFLDPSRKQCPCNEHPLTPHFYIVKLGFTGVYTFFLFLL